MNSKCNLFPRSCALVVIAALASIAPLRAQETQEKIEIDNATRTFILHLPQGYDRQQRYPLVILLHGQNQDADDMGRLTHFSQFAEKNGIIAVYPNATRGQWNIGVHPAQPSTGMQRRGGGRRGGWGGGGGGGGYPGGGYPGGGGGGGGGGYPGGGYPGGGGGYPGGGYPGGGGGYPGGGQRRGENPDETKNRPEPADDVAFLNQMLDQLLLKYSIDSHRIYATGLGDGGFMAMRAGCNMADRVAAIAPVSAALPKAMICLPSRPVPALFIDGTDDPVVPYSGGTFKPGRFPVLSAEESAKSWAKFDRCDEKPAQDKLPPLDRNKDKGAKETKTLTFNGCRDNSQVVLYEVKDGGNTWPGGEQYTTEKEVGKVSYSLNANESIWNFLNTKKIAADTASDQKSAEQH